MNIFSFHKMKATDIKISISTLSDATICLSYFTAVFIYELYIYQTEFLLYTKDPSTAKFLAVFFLPEIFCLCKVRH